MSGIWLGQVPLARPSWTPSFLSGPRPFLGSVTSLTDATFSQARSAPRAVIDFWSPTCPYCVAYKPDFEAVAARAPSDVLMATVNVNEAPQAAGSFGLTGIPLTVF